MPTLVDWSLAEGVAVRLAPRGPDTSPVQAHTVVAELRELAQLARDPVRELTGLDADPTLSPAVVVDRAEWIRSSISGFALALDPLTEARRDRGAPGVDQIGSRLTGVELGGALSWLSGKVLGQYEAFVPVGTPGRLLLVAPNIVRVERELELVPRDFRFWVCMHEETHRAQFAGVPWMPEHFLGEVRAFVQASDIPVRELLARGVDIARSLADAARGGSGPSVLEAAQTPEQRVIFDRLTGLMSLLEGHADYVMDEVGAAHIPTVATIRARFDHRRETAGTFDGFVRRVLGMQAKLRQYTAGSSFVRAVVDQAGADGFAQVWADPDHLPSAAEIEEPAAWMRRVLA